MTDETPLSIPATGGPQRDTLKEHCSTELKLALMAGRFTPGDQVTVRALADQLKFTIMPMREAVQRMVLAGALINLPNGRVSIPKPTRAEFLELIDIRQRLEPIACERATKHVTDQDLEQIAACQRDLVQAIANSALEESILCNLKFYFSIYKAAQSPHLSDLIEMVWLRFGAMIPQPVVLIYRWSSPRGQTEYVANQMKNHEALLGALQTRDTIAANRVMNRIITMNEEFCLRTFPFDDAAKE
ncbi:GntR family transcriptional regulator [Govanella unica]|uniref:GntR family transcriptional regulator n=1 Tax=Govanella unica TaxID=2975056 RepID=A0A9X3U075_9PROT|nr:GntR family transcriptional regulator [Govania unica]MDA5194529.1 GntR family transcriptional regulator [Govania unica]